MCRTCPGSKKCCRAAISAQRLVGSEANACPACHCSQRRWPRLAKLCVPDNFKGIFIFDKPSIPWLPHFDPSSDTFQDFAVWSIHSVNPSCRAWLLLASERPPLSPGPPIYQAQPRRSKSRIGVNLLTAASAPDCGRPWRPWLLSLRLLNAAVFLGGLGTPTTTAGQQADGTSRRKLPWPR